MIRFSWLAAALVATAVLVGSAGSAEACGGPSCCCAPPPIHTTLCVAPPCGCCCPQEVSVCIPGCCTEAPTISWRKGIFGRQIGLYTWPCCGHQVKVVVNRKCEIVKVRD